MYDSFGKYNPIVNLIFYVSAITLGVVFIHPVFQAVSLGLAVAHYALIKGNHAVRNLCGMIPLFILITVINPVFNQQGDHVLFTYFGRVFTLEAMAYGMSIGLMFITMMMWFSSYNRVMSGEKLIYIFGNLAPAVSMILVMVLRLVPSFSHQAEKIYAARQSIGKYVEARTFATDRKNLHNACDVLSSLTSWALEGGIISSDSMQSRGYGTVRRTHYSLYRFTSRDALLTALMGILMALIIGCGIAGGMEAVFVPSFGFATEGLPFTAGIVSYGLFLAVPVIIDLVEEIKWHFLRSRI